MKSFIALFLLQGVFAANAEQWSGELENGIVALHWRVSDGTLQGVSIDDELNGRTLQLRGPCFQLVPGDGTPLNSSDFKLEGLPKLEKLKPVPESPVLAEHSPGKQLVATFAAPKEHLSAAWCAILRDDSTYIRLQLTLYAMGREISLRRIVLFDNKIPGAQTAGAVDGSPVVAGNFFFGYEHPMAQNTVDADGTVRCSFFRNAILSVGEPLKQSCVIGIAPDGQLRRGFQAYIERERPRPYRPFLHYNSWFDIAWNDRKYNQDECLDVIHHIGRELVETRAVTLNSFLFDDGWDDGQTLWKFNSGFPDGFTALRDGASKYRAGIGVWISPFGGYAQAKEERIKYGVAHGFETNAFGFSLAGPKYFHQFREICLAMIRKYGVNTFKFDGLSAGARAGESGLVRDGDAVMQLIADLRAAEPNIYINQTTGTWPSPFWLLYVDSTWRGGEDHAFLGKGSLCQQWITYRDAQTYQNVVERAPLYPLNSLMLHGIIYAANAAGLEKVSDEDFAAQAREFFATGTQLQELYITPGLLNRRNWDDLAEAANWARANADVLLDTHWIGGDPAKDQIYGWASWSPAKAILVLRNPNDRAATFTADVGELFQLPPQARGHYEMRSPWRSDGQERPAALNAGQSHTFTLKPFELLILEEASVK